MPAFLWHRALTSGRKVAERETGLHHEPWAAEGDLGRVRSSLESARVQAYRCPDEGARCANSSRNGSPTCRGIGSRQMLDSCPGEIDDGARELERSEEEIFTIRDDCVSDSQCCRRC